MFTSDVDSVDDAVDNRRVVKMFDEIIVDKMVVVTVSVWGSHFTLKFPFIPP